ncbi:hypothetical protein QE152_g22776 [Popillia japonica]|uniref:Uncharacterized protein n=1 Tax=Popillia japonica TaxID=7064 RepID=A0AAW1KJX5_POPJA
MGSDKMYSYLVGEHKAITTIAITFASLGSESPQKQSRLSAVRQQQQSAHDSFYRISKLHLLRAMFFFYCNLLIQRITP